MVRVFDEANQGTQGKVFNCILFYFQYRPSGQEWFVLHRFTLISHSRFPGWTRVEIEEHWFKGWTDNYS